MLDVDADQYRGVLFGCAIGDALGAPVEGWAAAEIAMAHGGPLKSFLPGGYGAGAFTDDTQLTMALAEALLEGGCFDLEEIACAFGRWMRLRDEGAREVRGRDGDSATAGRRLYNGVPGNLSAVDSAGSGAASRAAPIGLLRCGTETTVEAAVLQAMLTHADPRALAGAAAVAVAVSHALRAIPFEGGSSSTQPPSRSRTSSRDWPPGSRASKSTWTGRLGKASRTLARRPSRWKRCRPRS